MKYITNKTRNEKEKKKCVCDWSHNELIYICCCYYKKTTTNHVQN